MFKNTKSIRVFESGQCACIVVRDKSKEFTKEYLDELYKFAMINDLYLENVEEPSTFGVKDEYKNKWVMEFTKAEYVSSEDHTRGLHAYTFGYFVPYEIQKNDQRYKEYLGVK